MRLCQIGSAICAAALASALWPGVLLAQAAPVQEDEPGVVAADLLDASVFPGSSKGMKVEAARDEGGVATVRTLGGEFILNKAADTIECRQRIAAQRPVALLRLPKGTLAGVKLSHQSDGAVIFSDQRGQVVVRINGDSLVMVRPAANGEIRAELLFTPDYHSHYKGNFNFYDPVGGVSFFEHGQSPEATCNAVNDPVKVSWPWRAGQVFWAGVSPPKQYPWQQSIEQRQIVYGSSLQRYMYPDDLSILRWRQFADVLMLHCENGWENWQMSMVPRDREGYQRVMRTAHENGMKVAVYTSPKAFLKGTVIEHLNTPDVNDPKATGWPTGSNVKEFLKQAERIIREFETDGLYFDEMYCTPKSLASSYFLARSSRQLVGDEDPLYYHCTEGTLGDRRPGELFGRTHCPTVHAYFDVLFKGEGVWDRWEPAYLRYVLGSYNTSNSIAVQATNKELGSLTADRVDRYLRFANARFLLMEHHFFTGEMDAVRENYLPRLTPNLQREIEPDLLRPTGVFKQFRESVREAKGRHQ